MRLALALGLSSWYHLLGIAHGQEQRSLDLETGLSETALAQELAGSYIEPRVTGAAISISPFMVLFAVFFWAMLWGIAGAFIGVPILIVLATLCARNPATRAIATVLSPDRPLLNRAVP
jgi:hypothetical protein